MGGRLDYMRYKSLSLVLPRLEDMGKQIKVLQMKNYRLKDVKKMLKRDKVPAKNLNAETLFDPEDLKKCYNEITSKEVVPDYEIFDYL